ncbi:hypothetical protein EXIGLDRAFT_837282 [Exidia glandulosa HHB12029]|uniref:F-box domain-containing protein n=1 Tax=Exidia glandulosa HHB12029 TaxID=1314781 RepID=A0A165GXX5_EXIGL|nr:hypothetical protein EXIGLDRAFT_837282 [Exidia glandulosa HHB12029]
MSGQISSVNLLALQEQLHDDEGTRRRLALRLEATRAAVEQAQHALAAAQLEQRLLEAQLLEKDRVLAIQRRLVSPISMLAHDTLLEIFYRVQSTVPEDWYPKCLYATRMAYQLASVSQEWRRVVLSTPRMWANIYFDFYLDPLDERWNSEEIEGRQPRCRALHLQLQRSMKVPLDICVKHYDPRRPGEVLYGSTFRAIMDTAARWRSFSLTVDTYGTGNHCILHHFQAPTPLLERFEINLSGEGHYLSADDATLHLPCDPQRPINFLPHAPRLRALEIESSLVPHVLSVRPPKLSTLQLVVEGYHARNVVPTYELACLLSKLPSLESLDIHAEADILPHNQAKPHPTVILALLRELKFTDCSVNTLAPVATTLSVPRLQKLSIDSFSGTAAELAFLKACGSGGVMEDTSRKS